MITLSFEKVEKIKSKFPLKESDYVKVSMSSVFLRNVEQNPILMQLSEIRLAKG